MRICLIVEEKYKGQRMPMAVGEQLRAQGHAVTVLEPQATATCLAELASGTGSGFDVYVLKTVSDGPGRSLIEAAAASGKVTVNSARGIRLVRDKAVCAAVARAHGIPFPQTWFLAHAGLLSQVPQEMYPLVVKPANGSANEGVHLVHSYAEAQELVWNGELLGSFLIAQPYLPNSGSDIKVYNAGGKVFAVRRPSPIGGQTGEDELMPVSPELRRLVLRIGQVFGLDIYGVDVLQTPAGWVAVDVNDFPSFSVVPEAVGWIADTIVDVTRRRLGRRARRVRRPQVAAPRPLRVLPQIA